MFSIFFVIMGFIMILKFLVTIYFYFYSIKKWKITKGKIISSNYEIINEDELGYQKQIRYSFVVNEKEYYSSAQNKFIPIP